MGFVQIMRLRTDRFDDLEAAHERWMAATEGERTVTREVVCRNRDDHGEYWLLVEFPDWESAMRNNDLPATAKIAAEIADLVDEPVQFTNLDVVRVD